MTRRLVLAIAAALLVGATAGCGGGGSNEPGERSWTDQVNDALVDRTCRNDGWRSFAVSEDDCRKTLRERLENDQTGR